MGSEQNVPSCDPILCANGCGFFGTAANMNLCSKCYRDLRAAEEQAAAAKAAMEKTLAVKSKHNDDGDDQPVAMETAKAAQSVAVNSESPEASGGSESRAKAANRCFSCDKKVGLTGFKCKCGGTFCGSHRHAENHHCSFDFKSAGRSAILKANPVVKADKVERI